MKCISCGAGTSPGTTTDVTDREKNLIVIRNVPCHTCNECNEIMYTADVVVKLEHMAAVIKNAMTEVAIVDYTNEVA